MSRNLDAPTIAGVTGKVVPSLFLARLDFPTTPLYVHNGIWKIPFGGNTYIGIYDYAMLDIIEENVENRPADIVMGIKRVPKKIIDPAITENFHGRAAYVYYAVASKMGLPISTPVEIWRGTMDYLELKLNDDGLQYSMTCKSAMSSWARTKVRRVTDANQQKRFPGDTAMKWLTTLEEKSVIWGPAPKTPANSSSGSNSAQVAPGPASHPGQGPQR